MQSLDGSVQPDLSVLGCAPLKKQYVLAGHRHTCDSGYVTSGLKLASLCFLGMSREELWAGCTCSSGCGTAGANTSSLVETSVE